MASAKNQEVIPNFEPRKPTADNLEILKDKNFFDRIVGEELGKKVVGEEDTRAATFLSLCAIFAEGAQINTILTEESSAGKSYVAKQICDLFPRERVEYYTKITPEALTYLHTAEKEPWHSWDMKILFLEDMPSKTLNCDTFKVMASEGSRAAVVVNHETKVFDIIGKPNMLITTAGGMPNLEVANRFNFINMNGTQDQTKAILRHIAELKAQGKKTEYLKEIKDCVACLCRVNVKIPFMPKIADRFPSKFIRARRDFTRFSNLIEASAAFHQFQRKKEDGVVIAERQDYEIASSAFSKISTNTQFGLAHRLKRAYECCQKMAYADGLEAKAFSADEISAKFANAGSRKTWYNYLDQLSGKELLHVENVRKEGALKESRHYLPTEQLEAIRLPKWDEL